ncbi:hypothetical protein VTK26DRAFT_2797 [Humicola hyalothermophila]
MLDAPVTPEPFPEPSQQLRPEIQGSWDSMIGDRSRSPSVKIETSASSAKSTASDSLTSNGTSIDNLVKVLQSKGWAIAPQKDSKPGQADNNVDKKNRRRKLFPCDFPGCEKVFTQNHLEAHRRTYTGEAPFVCTAPRCRRRFTQRVNLQICRKAFPRRPELNVHIRIHLGKKERVSFVCKMDDCNRTFSAKGNLKQHQHKFHRDTALALAAKFAAATDKNALTEEELELAKYMLTMYKNANKGIKGRSKGRKVEILPRPAYPYLSQPYNLHHQQQQVVQHLSPETMCPTTTISSTLPHANNRLPIHGLSSPTTYSMSRQPNSWSASRVKTGLVLLTTRRQHGSLVTVQTAAADSRAFSKTTEPTIDAYRNRPSILLALSLYIPLAVIAVMTYTTPPLEQCNIPFKSFFLATHLGNGNFAYFTGPNPIGENDIRQMFRREKFLKFQRRTPTSTKSLSQTYEYNYKLDGGQSGRASRKRPRRQGACDHDNTPPVVIDSKRGFKIGNSEKLQEFYDHRFQCIQQAEKYKRNEIDGNTQVIVTDDDMVMDFCFDDDEESSAMLGRPRADSVTSSQVPPTRTASLPLPPPLTPTSSAVLAIAAQYQATPFLPDLPIRSTQYGPPRILQDHCAYPDGGHNLTAVQPHDTSRCSSLFNPTTDFVAGPSPSAIYHHPSPWSQSHSPSTTAATTTTTTMPETSSPLFAYAPAHHHTHQH